jgi:hypothetical protein
MVSSHETHNHHRHCDRRRWPRSLWLDSRPNCAARDTDADRSADTHRHARANADRDSDPNALTFGKPVAERERLTKPDGGSLRLRALRNRMGL